MTLRRRLSHFQGLVTAGHGCDQLVTPDFNSASHKDIIHGQLRNKKKYFNPPPTTRSAIGPDDFAVDKNSSSCIKKEKKTNIKGNSNNSSNILPPHL